MIRFATIGTSAIVDRFLEAAALCEGLVHTAVFSRKKETAKAFAKKHGAEFIYTDLKELAESSDIDAVYIASPNSCHCEQAVEMLKHGKHVLCEKPAASNAAELQRMRAAAENGQAVLLEAMRSVYDPGFQAIEANLYRECVSAGAFQRGLDGHRSVLCTSAGTIVWNAGENRRSFRLSGKWCGWYGNHPGAVSGLAGSSAVFQNYKWIYGK